MPRHDEYACIAISDARKRQPRPFKKTQVPEYKARCARRRNLAQYCTNVWPGEPQAGDSVYYNGHPKTQ